jgi:cyclin-dependent kinase 3/cyclin-dependent kinase 12/13
LYNNKGEVKICDFGMANEYSKRRPQTKRILIPQFRAPEIYLGFLDKNFRIKI